MTIWYSYITSGLDEDNAVVAQVTTDTHSPWFKGHFPEDPILPGIAQLNMVTETIADVLQQNLLLKSIARIKFKKIIRPGDILDIHVKAAKKEHHYSFRISSMEEEVCSGRLVLALKQEQKRDMTTDATKIITRIADVIINELKLEDVTSETFDADLDLVDEVGIDSMDLATIALVLRDEYGIRIDEDDYPKLTTVRIIAEYISAKLAEEQ